MQIDANWLSGNFPNLCNLMPLGGGGQKAVFSADHPTDGAVVLKLLHTQSPEETNREIFAVQSVQSSRVPRIIERGTVSSHLGDLVWLREQRIDGETLRQRLQTGPLNEHDVLRLGIQMLEALAKAEAVNIVHRDVKPDNIMVDGNDDFWLLDFGLARHLSLESLTETHLAWGKGTPGYAPTEQFRNDKPAIDGRADLFGLGVTLYECFTGTNPFVQGTRNALQRCQNVERKRLPRLSLSIEQGDSVADIVAAMTQRRRDQRPLTVADALDWMESIHSAE